ncbi:zinc-finger domain-containing protein [Inquilinus limosus]
MQPAATLQPSEVIEVDRDVETVGCDGGGGPLGHPMVYYPIGHQSEVVCNYCGRRFVRKGNRHGH